MRSRPVPAAAARSLWRFVAAAALSLVAVSVQAQPAETALAGTVSSEREGRMEGVLVRAAREGSNMILTVVSDARGEYRFPADRLAPGSYEVSIRAVGYVLPGGPSRSVEIAAGASPRLDLELGEANVLELALQLSDPEWFMSYPLDDETKFTLFRDCSRCHTMQRPSMSTYDAEQLAWVMKRMVYSAGSSPMTFQLPAALVPHWGRAEGGEPTPLQRRQAEAVAAINLSDGMWDYELERLPRPSGKATEVIYTTWRLPVTARPHDTRIGDDGWIYFNHFNDNAIGRLNPQTGETQEWRWPYRAEEGSFAPTGARTLMGPDWQGRFHIGNQAQGGLTIFDPATETFELREPAGEGEMMEISASHVDGRAWRAARGEIYRIDLETWEAETVEASRPTFAYDIAADSRNNLYGAARASTYVWRVDAESLEVTYYDIPEEPRGVGGFGSGMRRGIVDGSDRLWWGRLRRQFHWNAGSDAAGGRGGHFVRGAFSLVLPLRCAPRR